MGKFRSKLKGKNNGKRWPKGQSSNSNPKTQKYREMAKSRFFQENIGNSNLTQQAIRKHNAMITYGHKSNTEKDLSQDLESMSLRTVEDDVEGSEYTGSMKSGTCKTFQTFASDWSQCSNVSFSKLLTRFDSNNAVHKDMLAVLAAVTDVIKNEGGKETPTEYFAALLQTLKVSDTEENLVAALSLLSMGIKSVPQAVLRKQFSDCAAVFVEVLEKNSESENGQLLRCVIGCLSVLLRAQEYALWGDSSTMKIFDSVLAFTLHSKPKVRKAAQHAITAILLGSCFMIATEDQTAKVPKVHPAANRVAEFCLAQIKPEALLSGHKSVLQTLWMLRDVLPVFSREYIKSTCESILSLMMHNDVYIKTCSLQALHALLESPRGNLSAPLALKLLRALQAARPPSGDSALGLAWTTVLQQAYTCLARLDLNLCVPNLASFVNICVSELWLSDVADVNTASTNALKAVLLDCVKPAVDSDAALLQHKSHIDSIFKCIGTGLDNPFNRAIKHVILTIAVCFEIGNEKIDYALAPLLRKLNDRRESNNFNNAKEAEHATACAVKALGPEFVLKIIPIRDGDKINLDRSWLLPVLKEKICNSKLKFFATEILQLATFCRQKSKELSEAKDVAGSHTYDLLCHQFWSLLPSFCNNPVDIRDSFKLMARVLGNVLKDNSEFRVSVMQALRKLISCSQGNDEDQKELGRFAKNYLPILFNIYMSPAKGSLAKGQRLAALETVQVYLTITDQPLREEFYTNALQQLENAKEDRHTKESILDIIRLLLLYQSKEKISDLFEKWIYPLSERVLEKPKKNKRIKKDSMNVDEDDKKELKYKDKVKFLEMEHKKAYRMLEEIFKSDQESCKQFLKENYKKIKKLLTTTLDKSADNNKAARLRCLEHLIKSVPYINAESKLIKSALAECVVCAKALNTQCRQCAFNLVCTIGNVLKTQDGGMRAYLDLLLAGLSAPMPWLIACSLKLLASALYNFSEDMGLEAVQELLEKAIEHMHSNDRDIVGSALSFLKVYTQVLPSDILIGSLPIIIKALSTMAEDCKRHHRLSIGYFLNRMTRKYGSETVEKLVPAEDTVMLSRLRNIRKMDNRKKRMKDGRQETDTDSEMDVKGVSKSLDDILRDSDSDMDYLEEEDRPRAKAKKTKVKNQAWIQDDPDNIVDLADVSSSRKITATKPTQKRLVEEQPLKKKDGGFKTAADGRLIISDAALDDDDDNEAPKPSGDIDADTDDTDDETKEDSKLLKAGTKRRYDDVLSLRSGRSANSRASTAASRYQAGGKGIHRPLSSAASVKSLGSDYKSKKAKGDVKKKGQLDPYAYLPLSRKNLNKRKKMVNTKQFKGIVKSKTKSGITKNRKR